MAVFLVKYAYRLAALELQDLKARNIGMGGSFNGEGGEQQRRVAMMPVRRRSKLPIQKSGDHN